MKIKDINNYFYTRCREEDDPFCLDQDQDPSHKK